MNDINWKKVEYETWDEAFRGLVVVVRQQSIRVAAYTQALYMQACNDGFAKNHPEGAQQIKSQYGDLAYKCGLYHQLGKALVPPEYQLWRDDFTDEEVAVYKKYTTDGRTLTAALQSRGQKAREKRRGDSDKEIATKNVPWLMIRESCEQHMERWNGTGFPEGRMGNHISPIAQIVGLAKELDRLSSEVKAEHPFDDACALLCSQRDVYWSAELISVLENAKSKCRAVYNKYIHYTMTVPKSIPLVDKRDGRPMGLSYRAMIGNNEGKIVAYEAFPWFGAIANRPGETEGIEDIHEMLVRTGLIADMAFYLMYEAADTVYRMQNCKLETMGVLLNMLPGFYSTGTQLQRFNQLFEDQPIDKAKLMITVPESAYVNASKANKEIMGRYLRNGIALVYDGYHPDKVEYTELAELGFRYIRVAPELYLNQETAELIGKLRESGFTVLGCAADTNDLLGWQIACGMAATGGTLSGVIVGEEELIRDSLLRERQ